MANESVTPAAPGDSSAAASRWQHDGVCVVGGDQLDPNTAQTPGMPLKTTQAGAVQVFVYISDHSYTQDIGCS